MDKDQEKSNQYSMRNPLKQYPAPEFPRQLQDRPGLTCKMTPEPDHGEESYKGFGRLKNRKALITGGDSGIGRAIAIAYAREGADVAINYLPEEERDAQEVIALIRAEGRKGIAIPGDIIHENFCQEMIKTASTELGGLDILVNNAGRQTAIDSIQDLTTEQFDNTFKVNVYALFWITKTALKYLPPGAAIINTTSIEAFNPEKNLLDYTQTKASIVAFTKSLSKQIINKGIRVNAVAPGPIWTPLQPSGGQPQEEVQKFGSDSILKRPGQPAEVAPLYVFLASQESSYITGEVMGVTGGMMPV
jgi:NAD(P)-dependent dehydrogenase (short-subunit alcohol dehydrogenase family)